MANSAAQQLNQEMLSLVDLNFILVNKLVVLLVVIVFFVTVTVVRRVQGKSLSSQAPTALKLSLLGLVLLYFEATLTGYPNYSLMLARLQSVIVLICLAKLVIYVLVDMVLSLRRHGDVPMLLRDAIRLAVYLAAGIVSLRLVFQVDLSAVITTTTVLTAAIAFAMQTTLSNAFYGFTVQIDSLMARGSWISIPEKNLFGEIVNVGFRYITLRTLDNNQVLVPNAVVVQSVVTTHGSIKEAAQERAALTLTIGLPYELPPEQAKTLLLQVLQEERLVLDEPQPVVRLQTMNDSSIVYLLKFWLTDPAQRNLALSELQTKAWYAVHRSGWSFPFPHRQLVTAPLKESFPNQRDEILAGVRQSHLFDVLTTDEVAHFVDSAKMRSFAPGEAAVRQGDAGSSLFFVLRGEMSVEVDGIEVARLGQGRMFGEMSLLTGEPRKATVRACTEAILAELSKSVIAELMDNNDKLMDRLGEALSRHTASNQQQQEQQVEPGTGERSPVDYLKRLRDFFGKG
jgi:small-conductance mechanosensitive channel/CRP-like cAMP-binding protein